MVSYFFLSRKRRMRKKVKRYSSFFYHSTEKISGGPQSASRMSGSIKPVFSHGPEYAYSAYFKPIILKSDIGKVLCKEYYFLRCKEYYFIIHAKNIIFSDVWLYYLLIFLGNSGVSFIILCIVLLAVFFMVAVTVGILFMYR